MIGLPPTLTERRILVLRLLLILVTSSTIVSIWATAHYPYNYAWERYYWHIASAILLVVMIGEYSKALTSRQAVWLALAFMNLILISRLLLLHTGPQGKDPSISIFFAGYSYVPMMYMFCFILLDARKALWSSLALWAIYATIGLAFCIPELDPPREGARTLLSYLLAGQPIVILLLSLIPHYELALDSTLRHLDMETRRAGTDMLTELLNRRGIEDGLEELWNDPDNQSKDCFLMMIDIDYFKRYNDSFGHQAGDKCLKLVARKIKQSIASKKAFAGRYGGEEFIVAGLLESPADAAKIAGDIQTGIATLHKEKRLPRTVTVSIGISGGVIPHHSRRQLLLEADRQLYLAKENGRNCIYGANA